MIMNLTGSHYDYFAGVAKRLNDMNWHRDLCPCSIHINVPQELNIIPNYRVIKFLLHFPDSDYFSEVPVITKDVYTWIEKEEDEELYIIPNVSLMILSDLLIESRHDISFQVKRSYDTYHGIREVKRYDITTIIDGNVIKLNNVVSLEQRVQMLTTAFERCL